VQEVTETEDGTGVPRIAPSLLGITDSTNALVIMSFIGTMLATSQADDVETEMLYHLLADLAAIYPDIIALAYDNFHDKIKETLTNSNNPSIIRSVSDIVSIALQHDSVRLRNSTTTLVNSFDDRSSTHGSIHGPGRNHISMLDEVKMQGIVQNYTFLPSQQSTTIIQWIPEIVGIIISQ
jgi:hypothetical protein